MAKFEKGKSGNPKGRPRTGLAFAEAVREKIDPQLVIDLALRVAADETIAVNDRLAALLPLIDRGYIKPPAVVAAHIEQHTKPQRDLSALPLALRIQMLEAIRSAPQLTDGNDSGNG